jgi:hypothetical protein
MVSMMLPSGLVEPLEELDVPLRAASSFAMNEEMVDCAEVVPEAAVVAAPSAVLDVAVAAESVDGSVGYDAVLDPVAAEVPAAAVLAVKLLMRL